MTFEDERLGTLAFPIRVKKKDTLIEKFVDMELKLVGFNSYGRNFGSIDIGIGVAYMMRTKIFKKCIDINPADGRLPYGEDGFQGIACRYNNYYMKQDLNNFFLTYCPDKLCDMSCDRKAISGYDAGTLWKQRCLRWYRTGTARLVLEFTTIFTTNIARTNDYIIIGLLRNIYYRLWKLLELFMLIVVISFPFILYNNFRDRESIENFLFISAIWPIIMILNLMCLKFKFRNSEDLYITWQMVFLYPMYLKMKFFMNVLGFIGCITFFVPFETYPGFFNIRNYAFQKEEIKEKEIELEKIIIK
jgi:hypothetical protein